MKNAPLACATAVAAACATGAPAVQNVQNATPPPETPHEAQYIEPDLPHLAMWIDQNCPALQGKGTPVLRPRELWGKDFGSTIDPSQWAFMGIEPGEEVAAIECARRALEGVGPPTLGYCSGEVGRASDDGRLLIVFECAAAKRRVDLKDTLEGK